MAVKQYRAWNPTAKEYVYWFAGEDIPSGIQGDTIVVIIDGNSPSGEIPNEIEKINYLPDDESSASDSYTSIVAAVNAGKLPLLIIGDERNSNYLPMSKASSEGYEFSFVGDDGIHTYIAANGTITYNLTEISSQELSAESPVKIEEDVIKVDTVELKVKEPLTFNADTMEIALDPALFSVNINGITDWIDITDEWKFVNNFSLVGSQSTIIIRYSPTFGIVQFVGDPDIGGSSGWNDNSWKTFLVYEGNRFYTTADDVDKQFWPELYPKDPSTRLFIGNDVSGTSNTVFGIIRYTGDPSNSVNRGLSFKIVINTNKENNYGVNILNVALKVSPKEV